MLNHLSLSENLGSQIVKLEVTSEALANCGDNVTLTCNAISSQKLDIKSFAWLDGRKTLCQYENGRPDPDVLCESIAEASHYKLTVTLINVMPVNEGKYICKLQSNLDVVADSTVVTVQSESLFIF